MTEWRDIPGLNYQASSDGNVRHKVKKRIMVGHIDRYGYRYHTIMLADGSQKSMKEHRLIAFAFHGISDKQIDHIDNNKLNNKPSNLQYCDALYNCQKRSRLKFGENTNINWHKEKQKFIVRATINGQRRHIGQFNTIEEAKRNLYQNV